MLSRFSCNSNASASESQRNLADVFHIHSLHSKYVAYYYTKYEVRTLHVIIMTA